MQVCQTPRLTLRHLTLNDDAFIVELVNDPDFLRYIGDKGVRSLADAHRYLESGPLASYAEHGFGLFLVERRRDGVSLGICGLLKRPTLADPDVGFAFLPSCRGRGYASEAAAASLAWGRREKGMDRIVAITSPDNAGSARVLEKIGMQDAGFTRLSDESEPVRLFVSRPRELGRV